MSLRLGEKIISGISRETKLNAHSLLDFKWTDHILNEMSWLRADTFSWQSGDVYTSVYNLLVAEYQNGTEETEGSITFKRSPNGYKITTDESGTSELYNNVGVAWYYILDITNRRFKLPRTKYGFDGISTKVGDFVSDMLQGHSHIVFQEDGNAPSNVVINSKSLFGANSKNNNTNAIKGVITDPSYGTVRIGSETRQKATQMYLYFYVGEFSQTATEQTAGITTEVLNNKADITTPSIQASYLKTSYVNGSSGYNIWSNGYCEQWGLHNNSDVISLLKKFKDTEYSVTATWETTSGVYERALTLYTKNVNTIYFHVGYYGNANVSFSGYNFNWKVCGYLAEGQY